MRLSRYLSFLTPNRLLILLSLYILLVILQIPLWERGNDGAVYAGYLKGWMQGRYTYWYDIKEYIPDTFRNPGYPALLALLGLISGEYWVIKLFNILMFCITMVMVVRIMERQTKQITAILLFAILVVVNPTVYYHNIFVSPDIVTGCLLAGWLYARIFWPDTWKKYIAVGLLAGFLFQVRPVFLFLPFLLVALDWLLQGKSFQILRQGCMLIIYVASMLPYGYWNYKAHGIFSVTSLEGGGGVMHLGYWSLKMPGYFEKRYWFNGAPVTLINFAKPQEVPDNIKAFEREWDVVDSLCAPYLTETDRKNMPYMKADSTRFVTYNGQYTYHREKLLKKLALQHYIQDWKYTIKIKTYTLFRLWITGMPRAIYESDNVGFKVNYWIGLLTTSVTLLLALIFIPLAFLRRKISVAYWLPVLVTVVYWGLIHLPFVLQARYTIPVRLLLFALIAASIHGVFFQKDDKEKAA